MPTSTPTVRFAEEGYVVLPDLVPAAAVEGLRVEADAVLSRLLAQMEAAETTDPGVTWWRLASGRPYVLKIKPVLDLAPVATDVAASAELGRAVARLLGGQQQLMEDKFMYKQVVDIHASWAALPVLGEEVCKHTDAAYFAARGYGRVLTVAVCLDDCTEAAGALRVWPGTHQQVIEQVHTASQGRSCPTTRRPIVPPSSSKRRPAR
jgi:ectoine hydroxylase